MSRRQSNRLARIEALLRKAFALGPAVPPPPPPATERPSPAPAAQGR